MSDVERNLWLAACRMTLDGISAIDDMLAIIDEFSRDDRIMIDLAWQRFLKIRKGVNDRAEAEADAP